MKKITLTKSLSFFVALFCAVNFGFGQSQIIISQYIETSLGTTPKGIEIYNISGVDITFSVTNNLQVYQGTNGGVCTNLPGTNITSGTLLANEVWVIGTTNLTAYASSNGLNLSGTRDYGFAFNGNDALQLYLGGVIQDAFGTCGTDPGSAWTGGGVTTIDNNLQIQDGLCVGNTAGWSDPSTRFDQIADGLVMTGFGNAPAPCCINSSTWTSGGWSPSAPTINTTVTIDYDYDTAIDGGSFSACSLTVNTGFTLTVTNGDYVEVENDVVADGGILVNSQANFIQISDIATFTDNSGGQVVVSKDKTSQSWYSYTYWGSPVANENIEGALSPTPTDRRFSFNAANFVDNDTEIGNTNTFTAGTPDGLDDNGDDWVNTPTGPMVPGVGYAATAGEFAPFFPITETFNFYGEFNNGEVLVPLVSNSGGAYEDWNLVGNPYPCAINAIDFLTYNSAFIGALYLWDQSTPPSSANGGSQNSNFSADDYAMINGSGGIAATSNPLNIPNGFVPSGQGFFVNAIASGNLTFNNSMRAVTNDNSQFFKSTKSKTSNNIANKLWVNLTSDNGVFNQILVSYINGATNANDGDFYDAPRSLSSVNSTSLYSVIENDNSKFAIQGKEANSINEDEIINLGFKTTINVATLYKLSVAKLEGDFLTNNSIFLVDNLLNKVHDLSVCDYTFTSAVGEFNSRFEIAFTNKTLATNTILLNTNSLKIVELQDDNVQFNTSTNLKIKTVNIYDLLGRQLYHFKGQNTSETYRLSNLNNSIYIAKVELSNGAVVTKKAVKK